MLEWVCRSSLLSYTLIITLPTRFSRKITPLQARVGWCRGSAIYFYYSFKHFLTQNLATSAQPRPGLHDVKVAKIYFLSNFGLLWQQLEGGQKRNIFVHGHWHDASLLHDIIHLKASALIVVISKWGWEKMIFNKYFMDLNWRLKGFWSELFISVMLQLRK